MASSARLVLSGVFVLLAIVVGWFLLSWPGLKPVVVSIYEPPLAYAESRVVDVGKVETDSKVPAAFILYNKGGKHLRISDVQTSCGCTVAKVSKKVIAPGDFTKIKVVLDTSIKLGKIRKEITVSSNDPKRPKLSLFLIGDVQPKPVEGHVKIMLQPKDPLVLFKGECATCHVARGQGKTGKALFLADCAMCHGQNAQGNHSSGPSLLNADYEKEASVTKIRGVIANGSPNSPQMPPFSKTKGGPLTDDEIDSLISFLKFQSFQNKMGLLGKEPAETEDEDLFQEALRQPH